MQSGKPSVKFAALAKSLPGSTDSRIADKFMRDIGEALTQLLDGDPSMASLAEALQVLGVFSELAKTAATTAAESSPLLWTALLSRIASICGHTTRMKDLLGVTMNGAGKAEDVDVQLLILLALLEAARALLAFPSATGLQKTLEGLETSVVRKATQEILDMAVLFFDEERRWSARMAELAKDKRVDFWAKTGPARLESIHKTTVELVKDYTSPYHDMEPAPERSVFPLAICPLFRSSYPFILASSQG